MRLVGDQILRKAPLAGIVLIALNMGYLPARTVAATADLAARAPAESPSLIQSLQRARALRSSSAPLAQRPSQGEAELLFQFYGPSVDRDLTELYGFLLRHEPSLVSPIAVSSDALWFGCDRSAETTEARCGTLGNATFAYNVLTKYFPTGRPSFVEDVASPLKRKYGRDAFPGLELVPFEVLASIDTRSAGDLAKLCDLYRWDGQRPCVAAWDEKQVSIFAQGVELRVRVPTGEAEAILREYRKTIRRGKSWEQRRVSAFRVREVVPQITSDSEAPCDTIDECADLVRLQRERVFGDDAPPSFDAPPRLIILDEFPTLSEEGCGVLAASSAIAPRVSGDVGAVPTEPHGDALVSILVGAPYGEWSPLLPGFPLSNVCVYNVTDNIDLLTKIRGLRTALSDGDSGQVNVVILSIKTKGAEVPSEDYLRDLQDAMRERDGIAVSLFFVIAAGNGPLVASVGRVGKNLNESCSVAPACVPSWGLRKLSNALVVGAAVLGPDVAALWVGSNRGGRTVDVAAPGVGIVGPSDVEIAGSIRRAFGVRTGTSLATVYSAALAVRAVVQESINDPAELKESIMAAVKPILDVSQNRPVAYRGDAGEVRAGLIKEPSALTSAGEIVWGDGSIEHGKISFGDPEIFLYDDEAGTGEKRCPVHRVRALLRVGADTFAAYCRGRDGEDLNGKRLDTRVGALVKSKNKCLATGKCARVGASGQWRAFSDIGELRQ